MRMIIDKNGFEYYENVPEGFTLASIDDFHYKGKIKIGLEYIIQWLDNKNYYEIHTIKEGLTASQLNPFIEGNRVYIKLPKESLPEQRTSKTEEA